MKILLLGGTSDAVKLAKQLIALKLDISYSVAGLVRQPSLDCKILTGGFQGNLAAYLRKNSIDLLLDATHPYAKNISKQAVQAAAEVNIPCWQYTRPAWQQQKDDNWIIFQNWHDLLAKLQNYQRPFFAMGQAPLLHLDDITESQYWTVRTAISQNINHPQLHTITAIGSFSLDAERDLIKQQNIDVLICKNSGGESVFSKLIAARQLKIPVLIQARPSQTKADKSFSKIEEIDNNVQLIL